MSYAYTQIPEAEGAGLEAAARQAMAQYPHMRVIVFDWKGARHVLKRMASKPRSRFKRSLLRGVLRILFPGHVLSGDFGLGDGLFEVKRIRALADAGMRVPAIELELPEAVVYGYCGVPLRQHLKQQSVIERERMLILAGRDLALFHRAGCWHGGAQLRNVLVQGESGEECFCRIDFEEDIEGLFALPVLQMYDLCLFVVEALRFADGETAAVALGKRLFDEYWSLHWSAEHQEIWRRLTRIAKYIGWLGPLLRLLNHKESNRVLVLSRLFDELESPRAASK